MKLRAKTILIISVLFHQQTNYFYLKIYWFYLVIQSKVERGLAIKEVYLHCWELKWRCLGLPAEVSSAETQFKLFFSSTEIVQINVASLFPFLNKSSFWYSRNSQIRTSILRKPPCFHPLSFPLTSNISKKNTPIIRNIFNIQKYNLASKILIIVYSTH
jgi:hypothetical protein